MDDKLIKATFERLSGQVRRQSQQIRTLSTLLAAVNDKFQRTGAVVASLSVGFQDIELTWPKPWPDTNYTVLIGIQGGDGVVTNLRYGLKIGTKSVTGCTVRVQALLSVGQFGVEVVGVRT